MITEWILAATSIVIAAGILAIVASLRKKPKETPKPEKPEASKIPPPLSPEEEASIKRTAELRELKSAIERGSSPLGTTENYMARFKAIRSKRIALDELEAKLELEKSIQKAEKDLSERQLKLEKQAASQ